jgi:hypothetical protein
MPRAERGRAKAVVAHGERALAWAPLTTGGIVVASEAALYEQSDASPEPTRWPWVQVQSAVWEPPMLTVTVREHDADRVLRMPLVDGSSLPAAIHERVRASILVSEHIPFGDGPLGARYVARRVGDEAAWTVTFDPGLDPADPTLRAEAAEHLANLRSVMGI